MAVGADHTPLKAGRAERALRQVDRLARDVVWWARRMTWPGLFASACAFGALSLHGGSASHAALGRRIAWSLGAGAAILVYRSGAARNVRDPRRLPWPDAVALLGLFSAFAVFFTRLARVNLEALKMGTLDLGLYDNIFWHTAHGDPLGTSFLMGGHHASAHFDPVLVLLAPVYWLRPQADTLLALQAAWVGSTVVPLYLFAREHLESRVAALLFAAAFLAHPAVHGATLYEFHSLTLAQPVLVWLLLFLTRGQWRAYALALGMALSCREDMALLACFVGVHAILLGERRAVRAGWTTVLAALAYFVVVKRWVMDSADVLNTGPQSYSFAYYFADLLPEHVPTFAGLLTTIATHPVFVLRAMLAPGKAAYVMTLLLPLVLLPLAARGARVLLVYGLTFSLLATKPAVFSTGFQYSSPIVPLAFCAAIVALGQIDQWRWVAACSLNPLAVRRAMLWMVFTASALVSFQLGAFDPCVPFVAGFQPIVRQLDESAQADLGWVRQAAASIPPDASVAATDHLGPFISNRREAYLFPQTTRVQYLLLDTRDYRDPKDADALAACLSSYVLVSTRGAMMLYRAAPPP